MCTLSCDGDDASGACATTNTTSATESPMPPASPPAAAAPPAASATAACEFHQTLPDEPLRDEELCERAPPAGRPAETARAAVDVRCEECWPGDDLRVGVGVGVGEGES